MRLEFKGEERGGINDREIYESVVCLANAEGGRLLIGVEDDGRITGAKPRHGTSTDATKLQAAIFNNTEPRINSRVSLIPTSQGNVISIEVDRYPEICATKAGVSLRRAMSIQGPTCVPFYPHEHIGRRVTLGLLDFSTQSCLESTFEDFDPLEFERLRQTIKRLHGDPSLSNLTNVDLAKALQLVDTNGGILVPNIAGLLLLGREEPLRRFIPTHEAAFQVLDVQGNVKVNDFFHGPLLATIDEIQKRFDARVQEEEIVIGMFRLPVPEYGRVAFREAILNALLHRDFSQMGTVFAQWHHDHMLVTNPGGLPDGITLQNILVHEPKPRNARLYEAAKRIGLVEKTGRGVDKIFHDQLRLGRPAPDYSRSDAGNVRVVLNGGKANLEFAKFVYEQDKSGHPLSLDELLILNMLFYERRVDTESASQVIQKNQGDARTVLENLHERGLVEGRGEKRGRVYVLSSTLYQCFHMEAEYVRAKGFEPIQQEQMVLDYVKKHGRITRAEAADLCRLNGFQASRLLRRLTDKYEEFQMVGSRRGAHYIWRKGKK
ncbi:MAG: ATP-binding protein [Nitrospirales bacterium]